MHTYIHAYMHTYIHTCIHTHTHTHTHTCLCMYVCMHVCMYVYRRRHAHQGPVRYPGPPPRSKYPAARKPRPSQHQGRMLVGADAASTCCVLNWLSCLRAPRGDNWVWCRHRPRATSRSFNCRGKSKMTSVPSPSPPNLSLRDPFNPRRLAHAPTRVVRASVSPHHPCASRLQRGLKASCMLHHPFGVTALASEHTSVFGGWCAYHIIWTLRRGCTQVRKHCNLLNVDEYRATRAGALPPAPTNSKTAS